MSEMIDADMECAQGFGCYSANRGRVACRQRSGCGLHRAAPMRANIERLAAQGHAECKLTLAAMEAVASLRQPSIAGYVSDRVFNGIRPITDAHCARLRESLSAALAEEG